MRTPKKNIQSQQRCAPAASARPDARAPGPAGGGQPQGEAHVSLPLSLVNALLGVWAQSTQVLNSLGSEMQEGPSPNPDWATLWGSSTLEHPALPGQMMTPVSLTQLELLAQSQKQVLEHPALEIQDMAPNQSAQAQQTTAYVRADRSERPLRPDAAGASMDANDGCNGAPDEHEPDPAVRAQALEDALRTPLFECPSCHFVHDHFTEQLVAVSLQGPGTRPDLSSIKLKVLECPRCLHTVEPPVAAGQRCTARDQMMARRLLLQRPLRPEDIYERLDELVDLGLRMGSLLLDALEPVVLSVDPLDGEIFDNDGTYLGYFILNLEDEWECEAFFSLEMLGLLRHVGGLVYQAVKLNDLPINPYAEPMVLDRVAGNEFGN